VALEAPRGAVVEHLLEQRFAVYAINPKQVDRFRDRHSPAGAKDDSRDARVLASALRTDRASFRLLQVEDPQTIELRDLSRLDESLKQDFRRACNQLWEQLHRYYPQMLALCPAVDEPWIWALLKKAPLPVTGAKLTPANIRQVLAANRIRRIQAEEIVAALRTTPLQVAPGTAEAASRHVRTLLPRLELLFRQIQETGESIESMLEAMTSEETNGQHRDATILLSLPGIGPVTGATMLAEAAEPLRQRDYHALRCYAGTAPVTRQSGKRRTVAMRRGCNPRLREALFHSVRSHVQWDPHSRAQYEKLRAAGHGHARAVRGVADRFLYLMVTLLKNGTLYDRQRRMAPESLAAA
jgi:transposase